MPEVGPARVHFLISVPETVKVGRHWLLPLVTEFTLVPGRGQKIPDPANIVGENIDELATKYYAN